MVPSIAKIHKHIRKLTHIQQKQKETQMLNGWSKMETSSCSINGRAASESSFAEVEQYSIYLILCLISGRCVKPAMYLLGVPISCSHYWYLKCEVQDWTLGKRPWTWEVKKHQEAVYPPYFLSLEWFVLFILHFGTHPKCVSHQKANCPNDHAGRYTNSDDSR